MRLKDIAQKIGAQIFNNKHHNEDINITGLAPLDRAGTTELTFLTNSKRESELAHSKAAAVIVNQVYNTCSIIQLVHPNPQEAMALASQCFYSYQHRFTGRSDKAFVHESAHVPASATVYPFAYIDAEAHIGEGCVIYPHTYIGVKANLGERCTIFPGAVIMSESKIGDRVIIHPNAVIGADGFGFASGKMGITKIPQIGHVQLDSDVEVGSLSNIDRATFDKTHIGKSTKVDSLVHIGHNVEIGEYSILCGQFGVAGSTKIGKRFLAAGQSGVNQGVTLGDGITIGGRCGVVQSHEEGGGVYLGTPEKPEREWKREVILLKNLPDLYKRLKALEKEVSKLSGEHQ